MATVIDPNDPNAVPTGAPVQIAGGGTAAPGASASGIAGSPGSPAQGTPTSAQSGTSGNFTDINAYLASNATGAQNLGNQSAGLINTAATNATNITNQGVTGFNNAVTAGTESYNPTLVNATLANPTSGVGNSALSTALTGSYTGPTSYAGSAQDAASLAGLQTADQQAQLSQSAGGRQQLLQQLETAPGATPYTAGGLSLNQALEQNTPGAIGTINTAAAAEQQLTPGYANTTSTEQGLINPAQTASAAAGTQTKNALGAGVTSLTQQIQAETTAAQQAQQVQNSTLASKLTNGGAGLTQSDLNTLGVSQAQIDNLTQLNQQLVAGGGQPINLANYLTPVSPNSISAGGVATPQEQANYNALNQILGTNPGNFLQAPTATTGTPYNASGAATAIQGQITAMQQAQAQTQATAAGYANAQAMQQAQASQQQGMGIMGGAMIGFQVAGPIGAVVGGILGALGSVVCTEVYLQGGITDRDRSMVYRYSKTFMTKQSYRGYHVWGIPLVQQMRKNKYAYKFGKFLVDSLLIEAHHKLLHTQERSIVGWMLVNILDPINYFIGGLVEEQDLTRLYKGVQ